MESYSLVPIAVVESCYKQKFAIPRQSGLVPTGRGRIRFLPEFSCAEAVEGLEQASHIWLQFVFHGIDKPSFGQQGDWSPRVRPPRLGGNQKIGVFASRSTHRPNPIGLSAVKLDKVVIEDKQVSLEVSGLDLLDGTPVLDIKPYIPYADCIESASHGFAEEEPEKLSVCFDSQAEEQLSEIQCGHSICLKTLIKEVLQQDPRPAYRQLDDRVYGVRLLNFELNWQYSQRDKGAEIRVLGLSVEG